MREWIKFFGLSFFSDKISRQAVRRGYKNFVLGAVLALALLFCGILAADLLPFSTHYKRASSFSAFARNGVVGTNLRVGSGKISSPLIVDTFSVAADASAYAINGYNLVVDTRRADAFDDFDAYYLSNDGKEQEITVEEYETLSDVAKRNFDFKIRYTSKELVLNDELTAVHEAYLAGINSEEYIRLQKQKGEISAEEYRKRVYNLYVKKYYPDLSAYENTGGAPLLRNYYYHNYVNGGAENYLFIFDDSLVGSFETNGGLKISFYGFYKNFPDGSTFLTEKEADGFITRSFYATAGFSSYIYLMNMLRLFPFIAVMLLLVAVIAYCILRILKSPRCNTIGGSVKTVGAYLFFGSLFSAVITLICGYFIPRNSLIIAALTSFFLILLIRTAVSLVLEAVSIKRAAVAQTDNIVTEK